MGGLRQSAIDKLLEAMNSHPKLKEEALEWISKEWDPKNNPSGTAYGERGSPSSVERRAVRRELFAPIWRCTPSIMHTSPHSRSMMAAGLGEAI
jgi:hypothetical protein